MPRLYLANGTRQVQEVPYRLPGDPQPYQVRIPVGMQVCLPHNLTGAQLEYIVKNLAVYGVVHCKEIDSRKVYVGMAYNIDQPVPRPKIEATLLHNLDVLREQGRKNREMAALAANQSLEKTLSLNPGLADLQELEMTITEETRPGQEVDETIGEGFVVSKDVTEAEHGKVDQSGGTRRRQRRRSRS